MARMMKDPAMAGHMHGHSMTFDRRVETSLPVVLTSALDDHREVERILLDRARALSVAPKKETIVLVGHGPVDDKANAVWLATMNKLALSVKKAGNFKGAAAATIRDDSDPSAKRRAGEALRKLISDAGKNGTAIVIPYLIARGGIEDHIKGILNGLRYRYDGKTLTPHPRIAQWAAAVASEGAKKDNMRIYSSQETTK
jgi:hypothetical protein